MKYRHLLLALLLLGGPSMASETVIKDATGNIVGDVYQQVTASFPMIGLADDALPPFLVPGAVRFAASHHEVTHWKQVWFNQSNCSTQGDFWFETDGNPGEFDNITGEGRFAFYADQEYHIANSSPATIQAASTRNQFNACVNFPLQTISGVNLRQGLGIIRTFTPPYQVVAP